ncbi:MAG: 4Fe-4S dicluster domain-containing protein [Proteobacteria bacterium]|nr:4Fe-4S dicluster domain-containing protein [Pseudomonadota bacterium]
MPQWYKNLTTALAAHGLLPRGAFHVGPEDGAPEGAGTILLTGNAGPGMWRAFGAARPGGAHALDAWSKTVLGDIARQFDASALFPSDGPPYLPFQRWAKKAEPLASSPLGILIHPDYGLWHGYRGALAFAETLPLPSRNDRASPCDGCTDRPCLSTCPVAAFGEGGYDVPACAAHLRTDAGADCMAQGCRARRACPVGQDYVYEPAQAEFHMAAFLNSRS